jgi:4-diphosphocytidyl-2-C-methyl-D-erythritol kinase
VTVRLFAPAKLTLSLRVVGVRPDGLHEIDAEMVTLDYGDTLEVTPDPTTRLTMRGPHASGIAVDETNLVARALAVVGRSAHVVLDKQVPAGAGLGGGSADAAAVLRWAGCDDADVAASLGADVVFCLRGGRARVGGIGERIEVLPFAAQTYTLWTPPLHVPTAAVYKKWDEMGGPHGEAGNDLEPAALALVPALRRARDEFADAVGQRPRLAGSGSTWFVAGEYPGAGRVVANTIAAVAG